MKGGGVLLVNTGGKKNTAWNLFLFFSYHQLVNAYDNIEPNFFFCLQVFLLPPVTLILFPQKQDGSRQENARMHFKNVFSLVCLPH